MALITGVLLRERYEVVEPIRAGGMGAVYLGRDRALANQQCAIKEILPATLSGPDGDYIKAKFRAEVEALARLDHPGIPRVRDFFEADSTMYIVMDYIHGQSLDDELVSTFQSTGAALAPEVVVADALQVLEILEYLHGQCPPLLHRDIKPSNLIREERTGRIKLVDFGLARNFSPGDMQTMVGTPGYSSPEQMAGRAEPRSDLYSLGVTMSQLLSGVTPKILELPSLREHMRDYSPELELIIRKAAARKADERFHTAADMTAALRMWFKNQLAHSQNLPPRPAPAPVMPRVTPSQPSPPPQPARPVTPPPTGATTSLWVPALAVAVALALGLWLGRVYSASRTPASSPTPPAVAALPVDATMASPKPASTPKPTPKPVSSRPPKARPTPARTAAAQPKPTPKPAPTPRVSTRPSLGTGPSYPVAHVRPTPVPAAPVPQPVARPPIGSQVPNPSTPSPSPIPIDASRVVQFQLPNYRSRNLGDRLVLESDDPRRPQITIQAFQLKDVQPQMVLQTLFRQHPGGRMTPGEIAWYNNGHVTVARARGVGDGTQVMKLELDPRGPMPPQQVMSLLRGVTFR